ncbi:MAG: hypothetical protein ACD_37C00457G0003 [uncultured bacterium]|nr:MAG: hypothetical protein ACD_37C00457G0003 [uncultured bacterium]
MNNNLKKDLKSRSHLFALAIINYIDTLNKDDLTIQIISKQILRSATSIGANIIEAQAGSSKKDFTNFFFYALKSANETKFWLEILRDSNKADKQTTETLLRESTEISNILGSSILTLRGRKK